MHNKYATFVLPVLAGLAIVGAGFSTWVFANQTTDTDSLSGTIGITNATNDGPECLVKIGKVAKGALSEEVSEFSLILDQLDDGNDRNALGDGIKAVEKTDNPNGALTALPNLGFSWELHDDVNAEFWTSNYEVSLSYSVQATIALDTYVKYTGTATSVTVAQQALTTNPIVVENAIKMVDAWTYVENKKPTNMSEYEAMSSEAATKNTVTIELTVTATFHAI